MSKISLPNNYENIDENEIKKIEGGADGDTVNSTFIEPPMLTSETTSAQNGVSNNNPSILSNLFSSLAPVLQPLVTRISTSIGNGVTNLIQSFFSNLFNR